MTIIDAEGQRIEKRRGYIFEASNPMEFALALNLLKVHLFFLSFLFKMGVSTFSPFV